MSFVIVNGFIIVVRERLIFLGVPLVISCLHTGQGFVGGAISPSKYPIQRNPQQVLHQYFIECIFSFLWDSLHNITLPGFVLL